MKPTIDRATIHQLNMAKKSDNIITMTMQVYINGFVDKFVERLAEYDQRMESKQKKPGKIADGLSNILETGQNTTLDVKSIKIAQNAISSVGASHNESQVNKLYLIVKDYYSRPREATEILINASAEVFQVFEHQFMTVATQTTSDAAIKLLAYEAVTRAFNYLKKEPGHTFTDSGVITKGVILGDSDTNIIGRNKNYQVKINNEVWCTNDLYNQVGLITDNHYYHLKKSSTSQNYGFRPLFKWEKEDKETVDNKLTFKSDKKRSYMKMSEKPEREYIYTIDVKIEEILDQLVFAYKNDKPGKKMNKFGVVYPVNSFTGRKQELEDLHRFILRDNPIDTTTSNITVICGLGGIGKTELARKYISIKGECYENIIWINAESRTTIAESFRNLAEETPEISIENEEDEAKIIKTAYKHFSESKTLFIFDDADRNFEFYKLLPPQQTSHKSKIPYVLITSRNRDWETDGDIKVIMLNKFIPSDAFILVIEALKINDESDSIRNAIESLVETMHRFPLAIQQCISLLKRKKVLDLEETIHRELKNYNENKKRLLNFEGFRGIDIDYNETTFTTWRKTIDKIANHEECTSGTVAKTILSIIAYLYHKDIKLEMFLNTIICEDNEEVEDAIYLLISYCMLEKQICSDTTLTVYELVQIVTRLNLKENEEKEVLMNTIEIINNFHSDNNYTNHFLYAWRYASKCKSVISKHYFNSLYGTNNNSPLDLLKMNGYIKEIDVLQKILDDLNLNILE